METSDDMSGDWQGLDSPTQIPRYSKIADILRNFMVSGRVLDVGCGEAVLLDWLPKNYIYTGIDPSAAAVNIANKRHPSAKIIHKKAEDFDSYGELFDIIIFNEMLYYADDPIALLKKYSILLNKNGKILCSIYQHPGRVSLKRRLMTYFDPRRPLSNIHCEKMIRKFMKHECWHIIEDCALPIPGSVTQWHIWLALPKC
jgi:2-polyprenyl-6-hydroxyphenyl methylase/3-demethylubiquinone-9 3-methyltransferase